MTVTAAPSFRLLNSHKFADLVQSVDCSNAKNVKVTFGSAKSVQQAKKAWSWVNSAPANTLVYIADGAGCGGEHGRQPYHVKGVTFDDKANIANLDVTSAGNWNEFVQDATVHIGGNSELVQNSKRASVHKKVKLSLEHAFTKHFYDADIGPAHLSVDCSDCGSHGSLDTEITVSTKDGFSASALTTDGVSFRMAIAITASAAITTSHLSQSIQLAKFPLAKFKIGDIVTIEPEITLQIQIGVTDIKGSITTVVGAEFVIPDGQPISIGSGLTGLNPQFKRIGPTVSGKVDATAKVNPLLTLDLSGKILGKHVTGGLGLAVPTLTLAVGADVNAPNTCNGGTSSVHYSVDVGVELDSFYGFGKPGDEPHKKAIFTRSTNLLKDCIAITH